MYKLRHIAREVAANLAMSIPAISDSRVKKGRTVAVSIEAKARIIVAQFEFFLDSILPISIARLPTWRDCSFQPAR
jgi:hypothetical protein